MRRRTHGYAWLIIVFLAGTASAQVQPGTTQSPWARGVSAADRSEAERLFAEGVELHEQLLRDQATARYEQALSRWENPHIRWNLALVTLDMGQYLRAHGHVERALSWGEEAFDPADWEKITELRQLLLRQHLAVIEARCDQPDAEVALDGKPWFRGPGVARQVVLPGEHVITARRPGYFPQARNVVLPAGTRGAVTVAMSVDGIFEKRRWASWKPWLVLGSGLAVGAVGAGLRWHARRQLGIAKEDLISHCGNEATCPPATPSSYRRSRWEDSIATGVLTTAGTAAAAGLVLLLLNQPRAYRTENREGGRFQLVPIASPDMAGISAGLRF